MSRHSATVAATRAPQARSRVGNGNALLPGMDGRSHAGRRYREVLGQLTADMGGDLSEAQSIIAMRAATLCIQCEAMEAASATGIAPLDLGAFVTASNALRRLLETLGIERKARDITPVLADYVKARG